MPTPDDLLARLRDQAAADASPPPADADELGALSFEAMVRQAGGAAETAWPMLNVRLHGLGIPGHDVALDDAFAILNPLQQACASIGQALARVATTAGKIPDVIRRATQFRLSPALSAGSVVFHLNAPAEVVTGEEIPGATGSDTLADITLTRLMSVITLAEQTDNTLDVADEVRRFGPRAAKHLNDLAGAVVSTDIDVTLQWKNGQTQRTAMLNRRGALGLQGAISHNRTQTKTVTLHGTLVTASTVEPIAIRSDDGRLVHLSATPELAWTLDRLCFRRVVAQAEEAITWRLSKGTEVRRYTLLTIHLAD